MDELAQQDPPNRKEAEEGEEKRLRRYGTPQHIEE
jgi:hypothetical protein